MPLQAWLLDAMEGPTPVSALIHAATMVTAGVYLVVRSNFIFELAPDAQTAVVVVATVTLLWGAIIGCAKDDIKKALAGSTMSQIGYMMLAAGLGPAGYAFAIFHLLTHGFFKANMFLGAGSVMHGMDDDVDMRHYGALQQGDAGHLPDLRDGLPRDHRLPRLLRLLVQGQDHRGGARRQPGRRPAARCSAPASPRFYMTRLMLMTFFTEKRWAKDVHPHESPKVMTVPLIVLAALSVLGGVLLLGDWIVDWLEPVIGHAEHHEPPLPALVITLLIAAVVAVGVAAAWFLVGRRDVPREAPQDVSFATRAARADLYGDAINDAVVVRPGAVARRRPDHVRPRRRRRCRQGRLVRRRRSVHQMRRLQNGFVRSYALSVLAGALLVVLALLAVNLA